MATRTYRWEATPDGQTWEKSGDLRTYNRPKEAWGNWEGVSDSFYFPIENAVETTGNTSLIATINALSLDAYIYAPDYCDCKYYWILDNGNTVPSVQKIYNSNMGEQHLTLTYTNNIKITTIATQILGVAIKLSAGSAEVRVNSSKPIIATITYDTTKFLKYWNGTNWVPTEVSYYNNNSWHKVATKRWNGTSWEEV